MSAKSAVLLAIAAIAAALLVHVLANALGNLLGGTANSVQVVADLVTYLLNALQLLGGINFMLL